MSDNLLQKAKREKLVRAISQTFSLENSVLEAIKAVPRHLFIDKSFEHMAYDDKPLSIGAGQTISQPSTVALQTQLLGCKIGDKVLEVGTGCGYQTAVLSQMGYRVFSVERQRELYMAAQRNLARTGYYKPILVHGDGFAGLKDFAKFKGIIVTCGAPEIPIELLNQLEIGGKLVIPVNEDNGNNNQRMNVVTKISDIDFERVTLGNFSFVPMVEGIVK